VRILAAVRLSDLTDETTSPERQMAKITAYAASGDHQVIGVAEDLDVSGAVSPFKRPQLGPWFDRLSEWDAICVAKLDRLTRSLLDFMTLVKWLDDHGKQVICLDPPLDLTTPSGRAFAQVLAVFAELERETIRARVLDAYNALRQAGNYTGGTVPFGYMPVKNDVKGWHLEQDPVYAPVVAEMASRYLSGTSLNRIAIWLNATEVPTSRNVVRIRQGKPVQKSEWAVATVRTILSSQNIMGMSITNGEPLRDADGLAIQRAEGIVSRDDYLKIQKLLSANSGKTGQRINSSALLQVAFCGRCDSPMYTVTNKSGEKIYHYYRCGKTKGACNESTIKAAALEDMISYALLSKLADVPMRTEVITAAEDHAAELANVTESIEALQSQYMSNKLSADMFATMVSKLESRQTALKALPSTPETTTYVSTGQMFGQHWEGLTRDGRHSFLRSSGVTVYAIHSDETGLSPYDFDPDGSTVLVTNNGIRVSVFLGSLAKLIELAAQG